MLLLFVLILTWTCFPFVQYSFILWLAVALGSYENIFLVLLSSLSVGSSSLQCSFWRLLCFFLSWSTFLFAEIRVRWVRNYQHFCCVFIWFTRIRHSMYSYSTMYSYQKLLQLCARYSYIQLSESNYNI